MSSQEAELRFFILQLHRNTEWYNLTKAENPNAPELKDFEKGIPEEKERIRAHPFLNKLTNSQRNKALSGHEIYKTKADFENELTICKDLRKNYRMLSNLVHPLPLSVERIDNERGRGIRNEYDISYCLMSMMIARRYLAASTVGIVDLFPNELGNKFKKPIDSLRPLQNKGFDIN